MKTQRRWSFTLSFLLLLWCAPPLFSGTTGKIAGRVIDKENKEPLPGVNIVIVGTSLGGVTDLNGNFFILNIPAGTYDVRASFIGYTTIVEKGVRVHNDKTTEVSFSLSPQAVEGDIIEVVAERPLIQKDNTASTRIATEEELRALPVTTVNQVVAVNAGAQGSGNNLHIRGGRAGEVAYLVDGLTVEDPQNRTIGLNVSTGALSELQVISGGFNAEYGNAQSAVINLSTQEGKDKYSGRVFYQTDHVGDGGIGESLQHFDWYEASLGGPEPLTTYVLPRLGLKIPGSMTFFTQGETRMSDRAGFQDDALADLNANSAIKESSKLNTSNALRNETIFGKLFGLGDNRESVINNWDTKLTWKMSPTRKLNLSWRGNHDNTHNWTFFIGRDVREVVAVAQKMGISDLVDADNDGSIDEETMDGIDNDRDGFVDEDNRLDNNYYLGDFSWGLDNDRDGRIDEEALNGIDDDRDGKIDEDLQPYDWKGYDHGVRNESRANQLSLNWTHTLSAKTFYEVKVGRFYTFTGAIPKLGKDGLSRSDFDELEDWIRRYDLAIAAIDRERNDGDNERVPDITELIEPYRGFGTPAEQFTDLNNNGNYDAGEPFVDFDGDGLYDLNNDPDRRNVNQTWQLQGINNPFRGQYINGSHWVISRAGFNKRTSTTYTLKFDLTSQMAQNHEIKTGAEANYFDLRNVSRQLLNPYDGRGLFGNEYSVFPNWQAVYFQDKMEYRTAIINLGVRVERFEQGEQVAVQDTSSPNIPRFDLPETKLSILPRVGLSFPVTEKDLFYFSYGHFFQRPRLVDVFNQVNQTIDSPNSIVGNPNLDPEKTITYEFGIQHQFGLNTLFKVTGFFKDIDNLLQIGQQFDAVGNVFRTYFNDTYGTVRGLELELIQRSGRYFSGNGTYTFQVAKTTHSTSRRTYTNESIFAQLPGKEYPADWDQRHRFVFNLDYHYRKNEGPRVIGLRVLENFNMNLLAQFGSGLPYTPETVTGSPLFEQTNTKRYPWNYVVDLRMRRHFKISSGVRAGVVMEVLNLLNRRNAIGPDDGGIVDAFRNRIGFTNDTPASTNRSYGGFATSAPNPNAWQNGRIVRVGFTTEF
jgi:outer membrane receptor protein involved in Fe transport